MIKLSFRHFCLCTALSTLLLTGCGANQIITADPTKDVTNVTTQLGNNGIDMTDNQNLDQLTENAFYVVQGNTYYPLSLDIQSASAEDNDIEEQIYPDESHRLFYNLETELNIPTIFIDKEHPENTNKLYYYASEGVLDYITWERYKDMGYTLGVQDIKRMQSGRYYIDLNDTEENFPVFPHNEFYDFKDQDKSYYFESIAKQPITSTNVDHGILVGFERGKEYDVDVYDGTEYNHMKATSNYHAFYGFELFASINYKPLQEHLFEIEIPSYFKTGYYNVNGLGLIRIVNGTSCNFTDTESYNEPMLFLPEDSDDHLSLYSDYIPLNHFTTSIDTSVGYNAKTSLDFDEEDSDLSDEKQTSNQFRNTVKRTFSAVLDKDSECTLSIQSEEPTGTISLVNTDQTIIQANYDEATHTYKLSTAGKGETVNIIITGFYEAYEIKADHMTLTEVPEATAAPTATTPPLPSTQNATN